MNEEQPTQSRRVIRHYSAEDRERLIREQAQSGMSKKDFCEERGVHVSTFHTWIKQRKTSGPQLAEVEVKRKEAPIEIELAGGRRLGFYINDEAAVARLIRGVLSC